MRYFFPSFWKKNNQSHAALDKKMIAHLSSSRMPNMKQLKYLGRILSHTEYLIVKILFCVLLINVTFLSWRWYMGNTQSVPEQGGKYTEALIGSPRYINPVLLQNNDVDRDLAQLVYSGLMRYGIDRRIIPDLAERYELSSDSLTYTFYLRKDVLWQDGEPFNADDVLFTVAQIQNASIKSPLAASFKDVFVQKKDDYTIQFGIKKPFAPFLDLMTTQIIPKHLWGQITPEGFSLATLNVRPIGTGAWKFKSLKKASDGTIHTYTLVSNDNYYGQRPYLQSLVFKFYPDGESAIQALKNRNVDGISFLPHELRTRLIKDTGLQYYTFNLPQYTALFLNRENNADIASKAVRQALAYGIDKQRIVSDVLAGEGAVIHSPILPGFLGYNEQGKAYSYNAQKAKELLHGEGWKEDERGIMMREKREFHVIITTVNKPESIAMATRIQESWRTIGVTSEIQSVDPLRIKEDVIDPRRYQAFLYGAIIGSDPDIYPYWHSSQSRAPGLNLSLFAHAEADKLLEEGRMLSDPSQRAEKYKKFGDIILEEVPAIFLVSPTYNYVMIKKIQGVTDKKQIIYPSDRFGDISAWHSKTKREWKKK
jgi:peptide/nickel transport system substrate-binding protein